ncbi:MAG: flagellar motor switch protein FliG [Deltaproteobacteria bacterium]|nr:flagellar motor switch protein FliG [Deltaproteobacteria bacterium]
MDTTQLSGALKVAVLIHSMGEKISRDILDRMGETEKKIVQQHMSQIGSISPDVVEKIAQEFTLLAEKIKQRQSQGLVPAKTGDNEASRSEPLHASDPNPESSPRESEPDTEPVEEESTLKALQSIDPDQLVEMIKDEHPQTIAVIVVHLNPESGSAVLCKLPDNLRVEVAMRIARLDKVLSGMINEIDRVFEDFMKKKKSSATHKTGGVSHLAELLNMTEGSAGERILNDIEEVNPDLAAQIKQMMFVFEDLVLVDDKGMQKVLRRVETPKLALALKGASEEVKHKIFKNMSERAGVMLKEEIEAIGAVRMRDVEEAQQNITKIIQELEAKSEIVISGRKGGDYIA